MQHLTSAEYPPIPLSKERLHGPKANGVEMQRQLQRLQIGHGKSCQRYLDQALVCGAVAEAQDSQPGTISTASDATETLQEISTPRGQLVHHSHVEGPGDRCRVQVRSRPQ